MFDPFAATTYFESDGTVFEAPWSARAASAIAPLPDLATEPRLFISEATNRLRVRMVHELPEDAAVEQGGRRFDRFENKLYPRDEDRIGIPAMVLIWELQPGGRWERITTEPTRFNPFYEPSNDAPDRKARAGTVTLRELLIHRDPGAELRELGGDLDPGLLTLFPPMDGDSEPSAAVFHLDETHHLVAAISTGDEVQITEPLVYCATPCDRWQQLTDSSTPPGAFDQRAYASHLPLYIGVRHGLALVEEMVRGDRVAFYASGGATPVMRIESSIGAWGPFRGFWARTR